jgi:hypothetical protein
MKNNNKINKRKTQRDAIVENILEKFNPDGNPSEEMIKTSDYLNALKYIGDLYGLKKTKIISFKGEQDIDFDGKTDTKTDSKD